MARKPGRAKGSPAHARSRQHSWHLVSNEDLVWFQDLQRCENVLSMTLGWPALTCTQTPCWNAMEVHFSGITLTEHLSTHLDERFTSTTDMSITGSCKELARAADSECFRSCLY
jgi:hypothetical protein